MPVHNIWETQQPDPDGARLLRDLPQEIIIRGGGGGN